MRILITEPCYKDFGGYFRAFGIASRLAKKNVKVDLLISSNKKFSLWIHRYSPINNLTIYELPRIEINHFITGRILRAIISLFFVLLRGYDIIHCFALVQIESALPFIVANLTKKKVLIDWDDYWTEAHTLVPIYDNLVVRGYLKWCEYKLQSLAVYATTTSEFLKYELSKIGVNNSLVIVNGVDSTQYSPISKAKARKILGISEKQKILLSFGHTFFRERTQLMLQIFSEIYAMDKRFQLLLNQDVKLLMKEQAGKLRLSQDVINHIVNVGYLDKKKLPLYVGAADFILFAMGDTNSERACFPTRIGTYLNGEKIIIMNKTNTQACKTLEKYNCAIIDDSPKKIAKKVINVFENKQMLIKFKENVSTAKTDMLWENQVDLLVNFYENIIAE